MERIEPRMPKLFCHRGCPAWPHHTTEAWRGVSHGLAMMLSRGACADVTRCRLNISFIDKDGEKYDFQVSEGDNLLDIAQANDLEMEGACGGSCACSTCHVIVEDPDVFDKMEEPSDDENDMLDLAFGLTETSRLGCQVIMSKELDGLVVRLPSMTRNLQASDFEPKK
ncbi:2Fe-2S ferredoxin-type domain-containing protein [Aspergillus pseudotamarii]|uniref:2Fe-2S ferredoxin-type domain-containing protein n=1 Tax=Aspergillus pseudotamarii TaxID=132259 RepID=A0A5N6SLS7_ASPPS|nr:2Fe-2S ferredoxin-type domain-containing protein [Aspergillus pseudotamarii]KAE8134857.1 2Fe-2S ferredoxin-type domain-containing protein [Aspergillus pseudotamarii]